MNRRELLKLGGAAVFVPPIVAETQVTPRKPKYHAGGIVSLGGRGLPKQESECVIPRRPKRAGAVTVYFNGKPVFEITNIRYVRRDMVEVPSENPMACQFAPGGVTEWCADGHFLRDVGPYIAASDPMNITVDYGGKPVVSRGYIKGYSLCDFADQGTLILEILPTQP